MLGQTLRVTNWNSNRSTIFLEAFLNQTSTYRNHDILLIQEPGYLRPKCSFPTHPGWNIFTPEGRDINPATARAATYIKKDIDPSTISQVPSSSKDLVCLLLTADTPTLIVNVYNQPNQPDGDHGRTLRELDSVIQRVKAEHSSVDLLLAGDWNLHHPLWGGTEAAQARWMEPISYCQ